MNSCIQASAPGKIVVCGEYAVLGGAHAIAMAIDRRSKVTIKGRARAPSEVMAPGYADVVAEFTASGNELNWADERQSLRLFELAWRAQENVTYEPKVFTLDTQAFVNAPTQQKLGLGSSAALTVALCAALCESGEIGHLAHSVHSAFQGGVGSGVDIACSLAGGLIDFDPATLASSALQWPDGLFYAVLWSGRPVDTKHQIARFTDAKSRVPSADDALIDASNDIVAMWREATPQSIVDTLRDYTETLRRFSDTNDLDIFAAGHAELLQAAIASGVAYKPCGAGGGDIGIALSADRDELQNYVQNLPGPAVLLPCQLDATGICVESLAEPTVAQGPT